MHARAIVCVLRDFLVFFIFILVNARLTLSSLLYNAYNIITI